MASEQAESFLNDFERFIVEAVRKDVREGAGRGISHDDAYNEARQVMLDRVDAAAPMHVEMHVIDPKAAQEEEEAEEAKQDAESKE